MKVEKIAVKSGCDMPGCGGRAVYSFSKTGSKRFSIALCEECALAICAAMDKATKPDSEVKGDE